MPDSSADSLRLRLDVPDRVPAGATVPITLHVENTTDRTLTLYLVGRTITFDIIVERPDGAVVWRRLEGVVVPAILRLDTLPAGEELVLESTWDQRSNAGETVPAGEYRVRAEVLTEGEPLGSGVRALRVVG